MEDHFATQRVALRVNMEKSLEGMNVHVSQFPVKEQLVPPFICIERPSLQFPENSMLAAVTWTIMIYGTREAPQSFTPKLEKILGVVLLGLAHLKKFTLLDVNPIDAEASNYELPAFQIDIGAPYPNC